MKSARENGLDHEDQEYLESEINKPRTLFEIVAGATTPGLARQVYVASLLPSISLQTTKELISDSSLAYFT